MRSRIPALALAGLALLGLTGCDLRGDLVVREDGSGRFTYVVGIDKDILAGLAPEENPLEEMRRTVAAQPFPIQLTGYETQEVTGLRATFEFADAAELRARLMDLHDRGTRLTAAFTFADLLVRRTRSGWWFQARTPERGQSAAALPFDIDGQDDADGAGGADGADGAGDDEPTVRAKFRVTLPGDDRDDNAYRTSRRNGTSTFRWQIGTDTGVDGYNMRGETIRPAGSGSPWPAVLLGTGLAVAAVLGLRRRRRRTGGAGSRAGDRGVP